MIMSSPPCSLPLWLCQNTVVLMPGRSQLLCCAEENKAVRFVRVPAVTGYAGYWLRDNIRTTQAPTPIDVMLNLGAIVHKSRDTIPGMWVSDGTVQGANGNQ